MKPTKGQINDISKYFSPAADAEILFEGGNDGMKDGIPFFNGDFIVHIKRKGTFRFTEGVLTKRIK